MTVAVALVTQESNFMPIKICPICSTEFTVKQSHYNRRVCCSIACGAELKKTKYAGDGNPNYGNRGSANPIWTGGRVINGGGYIWLYMPNHPMSVGNYVLEHRYVMSKHLGRLLTEEEVVHHIDGNKQNNELSNLQLVSLGEHTAMHNKTKCVPRDTTTGRFVKRKEC